MLVSRSVHLTFSGVAKKLRLSAWDQYTWHILGICLIPEQLLGVDRGILHVGPTKSVTFSPGFSLRVAMYNVCISTNGIVLSESSGRSFLKLGSTGAHDQGL